MNFKTNSVRTSFYPLYICEIKHIFEKFYRNIIHEKNLQINICMYIT